MPLTPSFTGMGQARPISQDEELLAHALNYSEAAVIGLRNEQRLTQEATNTVIAMVSDRQFDAREIGTDRVQQLEKKLLREFGGDVWVFDGFHKPMDGNQDTKMILRSIESVVRELFGDPRFAGSLTFSFEPTSSEDDGQRTFGTFMGSMWAQILARQIGSDKVLLALGIFVDASYIKVNLSAKPLYSKYFSGIMSSYSLRVNCRLQKVENVFLIFFLFSYSAIAECQRKQALPERRRAVFWLLSCRQLRRSNRITGGEKGARITVTPCMFPRNFFGAS